MKNKRWIEGRQSGSWHLGLGWEGQRVNNKVDTTQCKRVWSWDCNTDSRVNTEQLADRSHRADLTAYSMPLAACLWRRAQDHISQNTLVHTAQCGTFTCFVWPGSTGQPTGHHVDIRYVLAV